MIGMSAVIFIPDDTAKTGYPQPLMLQSVMGAPLLAWLANALFDSGVGRFFLVCHDRYVEAARACLPAEAEVMTTMDSDPADLLHVFLSTAEDAEHTITVVTGPAVYLPQLAPQAAGRFPRVYGVSREELMQKLVEIRYERNDLNFTRNTFRVRGDTVEIYPVYWSGRAIRVEFFGDEIDRISEINAVSGMPERVISHVAIYPASHYVASRDKLNRAILEIEREMEERERWFKEHDKLLEAQRIRQRTMYDIEMLQEIGFCSGIENYSRVISGRAPGTPPMTLLDYFPKDFLLFVDESHVTLPQVRAMYAGDRSRKESLVEYGFRLPSAFDNRPLTFPEFEEKVHQAIYVSATPGEYERSRAGQIAEQVIRPTGLLDPKVEVRPIDGQVDDLIGECNRIIERKERVLVTTLTKKMAEDLTTYLQNAGIRVRYMHSDVAALERMEILRDLRMAKFDVLVGINLLREGLDLPEVSLVAILDADKEGFLRSETSLIQTIGRAARNAEGRVIMYADKITPAMRAAIDETERRRGIQDAYNKAHGIVPKTIVKDVRELIEITQAEGEAQRRDGVKMTAAEREREIAKLEKEMRAAAKQMEYEYAAVLRDRIIELRGQKS